ncbi:hypothetical protein GCM10023216_25300 [Isoptericola chiayiensis]|uniref:DUF6318 domain-containing protein n=1 Tax=Isoptericola chiayiensis TaxID=579446 RepID=A0ABP8YL16_9MICO|nr:DUF6318 family protein [Isoptericola chiayiensis]NOW00967.1 hypothetical protein [Isoptericola chiayiensis]
MTRTTRHHLTSTAILLTSVLLVAGCTDDDAEPGATSSELPLPASVTASPSDEPSPTPSPSPSGPEKPERPAAMDKKDGDGAAAAAEYFLALYDYTLKTGDTRTLGKMSHRACGFCEDTIEEAEAILNDGETYEGGQLTFELIKSFDRDAVTGIYPLDADVEQAAASIEKENGEVVWEQDRTTTEARIEMGLRDGEWVVVEIAGRPE